ncbi:peptidoglycan-binding protein [Actinophytocola xinjiangensis]|uniref:Peptidoglycan-binding protein n=2 Tax=Actinophytocola xinjiangensis TaxID=485602 RepID=A0A7Z0WS76_9PSEU|nr:peptidoglycan-binding protein [Actinophytocola xinjiangensis]
MLCAVMMMLAGLATPASAAPSWPVLRTGNTGANVTTAQYLLRAHGRTISPDSDFGSATKAAVVAFQQSKGFTADGVVGPQTWTGLVITVKQGASGDAVRAAQIQLNKFRSALVIDGSFGPATATAVRKFQTDNGLAVDGVIGPQTWAHLVGQAGSGCPVPSQPDIEVARIVHRTATGLGANDRVILAGFETGLVESNMHNLPCGDRDSLGVFQQRPSQGWGTPVQVVDVAYASNSFFTRAIPVAAAHPDWSAGRVAQAVQVSAFPDRYDQAESAARALIARVESAAAQAR